MRIRKQSHVHVDSICIILYAVTMSMRGHWKPSEDFNEQTVNVDGKEKTKWSCKHEPCDKVFRDNATQQGVRGVLWRWCGVVEGMGQERT
jgi:hypothetical protein